MFGNDKIHRMAVIKSIAFPKLGTSNGGLDWNDVEVLMEEYLSTLDIDVYMCLDSKKEVGHY